MMLAAIFGELVAGWIVADLLGGLVHWLEDRVLTEETPLMASVVRDNRRHHTDPMAFTRSSFWQRNAAAASLTLAIALLRGAAFGPSWLLLSAAIGGCISNEVHCLAHARRGTVTRVLQDIGVFQSPAVHAGHHKPPQDVRYCPLTNWCNPVLDALGVWQRLEQFFRIDQRAR